MNNHAISIALSRSSYISQKIFIPTFRLRSLADKISAVHRVVFADILLV